MELTLDLAPLVPEGEERLGRAHVTVGDVTDLTGKAVCRLYYVKPVLTPDDPVDLHEYRKGSATFPHESTADQFFDEAQFESYRELGYRAGQEVARAVNA